MLALLEDLETSLCDKALQLQGAFSFPSNCGTLFGLDFGWSWHSIHPLVLGFNMFQFQSIH